MQYNVNPYADDTAVWLKLYKEALTTLPADLFTAWLIGVGMFGTDAERAHKGQTILPLLQKEHRQRMAAARQHERDMAARRRS